MHEVSSILQDDTLPESLKASRINEKVKNYSVFANKLLAPTKALQHTTATTTAGQEEEEEASENFFNSLPSTFRSPAKVLMDKLRKHPETIKWNPTTHEVSVQGRTLRGSNIIDLIGHVLRSRKSAQAPVHGNAFLKVLADLNVPEELVKNKYQISRFRSYKHIAGGRGELGEEEEEEEPLFHERQVLKAKRQLAGMKRYSDGVKRVPAKKKRKVKWWSIY